jgi:molecular chaperone HscA
MAKIPINLKEGTVANQEIIVGIDLGTTNSLVAYIRDDLPVTVKDATGKNALVPSIVYFDRNDEIVVGEEARKMLVKEPERTIFSVKRLMGKSYQDIAAHKDFFSYKIIDDDTESLVKIEIDGKYYNPVELSGHILKYLKERVENEIKMSVTRAVITVPAYFNDAQRQATRDAGKLAGLDVLRIVNEPTAASLAYGIQQNSSEPQIIAVYDLGGGTFDISILRLDQGIYDVLSTSGDTFLGGDDIDRAIMDYWLQTGQADYSQTKEDPQLRQQLRLLAESAKRILSVQEHYKGKMDNISLTLRRSDLEHLLSPLIDKTLDSCQKALKDAGLDPAKIDHVILVGGSTRIPYLKDRVSAFFGKRVHDTLDPDEVVALGAAIQANILAGNQKDMLLLDITPLSLGIETVGGLMDVIIPRNSKIPVSAGRNYTTSIDGQKNLKIAIYQGERDLVENNRKLGEFILSEIPPMPAGIPKIEISFIIDADGILKVRARELRSQKSQQIEIRSAYGISEEEMAKMLLESLEHAQEDIAVKALREAINEANHIILSTEKFIRQNQDIFPEEDIAKLDQLKEDLKKSITGNNKNAIEKAMHALNSFAEPLAHQAMDVQIGKAIKGKSIGT